MIEKSLQVASDYFDKLMVQRSSYSVKSLIITEDKFQKEKDWKIFISQNDDGVKLNRGRQGSKDSGRVIWQNFVGMTKPEDASEKLLPLFIDAEIENNAWASKMIHLGSGHDHVFHLMHLALNNKITNFIIFNFDAHADMRDDDLLHSGTPFRYFFNQCKNQLSSYHIIQVGLNRFQQNTKDLVLDSAQVESIWSHEVSMERLQHKLQQLKITMKSMVPEETLIILSLDADVLSGAVMPAVSAVNPLGVEVTLVKKFAFELKKEFPQFQKVLGIYEYNPIYDDTSARGAKTLATFIYDWIF